MGDTSVSKITENLYLGSTPENVLVLDKLKEIGITYFVSLQQNQPDYFDKRYVLWLPTMNNGVPTFEQLEEGIKYIKEKVGNGEKVYVHCRFGCGRGPLLVAAYLISVGKTVKEALDIIYLKRPYAHLNDNQEESLYEFAQTASI